MLPRQAQPLEGRELDKNALDARAVYICTIKTFAQQVCTTLDTIKKAIKGDLAA
jgi:hypothetical protein